VAGAATLVERHVPAALNREDWVSVAAWLHALPEAVIYGSPALLLAKGWVSHFSGRSVPITAMLVELDALLATVDVDPAAIAAWEAERDALSLAALLPSTRDPIEAVACALRAVENAPANHRLAAGLAQFWLGCARQAVGRTDEAMRGLTKVAELHEDRIDAGSIRALGGLMFVHRQAGNFRACEEVSEQILTLARQNNLPVAAGWARWMLGWLAYEQDNLDSAAEHFTAVLDDAQRVHLHTLCEAMFGLALTYQARQKPGEAAGALGRLLEIILNATALEYLPLLRGFKARLALLQGEWQAAIDWLEMADFAVIDSSTLDGFEHPFLTRVKVLLAEGSEPSIARAMRDLEELRAHTAFIHHRAHQIEILALSAVMLNALEQTEEAVVALRESLSLAESAGFVRPYLDLGPALLPLLRRLSDMEPASAFLERLQRAVTGSPEAQTAHQAPIRLSLQSDAILELLTVREAEVLECLARRLSYKEISDELFISFHTVKSHATSIYDKLGVDNRRQAIARAQSLGWVPLGVPVSGTPERLTKTAGPIAT
jgi:LuxR family transcriptional regulator, maltose regulon positive regulatory protein